MAKMVALIIMAWKLVRYKLQCIGRSDCSHGDRRRKLIVYYKCGNGSYNDGNGSCRCCRGCSIVSIFVVVEVEGLHFNCYCKKWWW
jgi:hypothetical protein